MSRNCIWFSWGALVVILGCSRPPDRAPAHSAERTSTLPGRSATEPADSSDDGQWIMPARNYASTRYSALTQITNQNARELRLAWSFMWVPADLAYVVAALAIAASWLQKREPRTVRA